MMTLLDQSSCRCKPDTPDYTRIKAYFHKSPDAATQQVRLIKNNITVTDLQKNRKSEKVLAKS